MSLDSALLIASSGLANVGRSLAIVSQNIANASTADYAREIAEQSSATAGGAPDGVVSAPSQRAIDTHLRAAVLSQDSLLAGLTTQQTLLRPIDSAQGEPGAGADVAGLLGSLSDAFTALQAAPESQPQQSAVVAAAQSLAAQLNSLSRAYQNGRQGAQDQVASDVGSLNDALGRIGSLSDTIIKLRASGAATADLENQRDAAEHDAASYLTLKFVDQPNGDTLVIGGSGLLLPTRPTHGGGLAVGAASLGPTVTYPGGGAPPVTLDGVDVTSQLTGGTIGAALTLRDQTLPTFQAELDEFAHTVSTRFDAQGLRLFSDPSGQVPVSSAPPVQSGYVGYAGTIGVNPAVLAQPSLVRDGTQAVASNPAGASAFTPNPASGPAGFTTLIERVLDFALGTQAQVGVPQSPPAASGLGPSGTLSAPYAAPADLASFASAVVGAQSQVSATTASDLSNAGALKTTLQSKLSSETGVNVDTELSTMVGLQNAYGANARVLSAAQSMWAQLLQAVS